MARRNVGLLIVMDSTAEGLEMVFVPSPDNFFFKKRVHQIRGQSIGKFPDLKRRVELHTGILSASSNRWQQ